jgi:hypothetical protein
VESKLTEYLGSPQKAKFADRYEAAVLQFADEPWQRMYRLLKDDASTYRYLDGAQLVKHALGLRRCSPNEDVSLLYLFWEPENAVDYAAFSAHRDEINHFSSVVGDSKLTFESLAYSPLWQQWHTSSTGASDQTKRLHSERLRERYGVLI